ncbi:hypothetical protein, partial [Frisingicoccus sp.]|uniref:hypothetical protein n=1 Tax=Frisingicoccus sp. TaxID=1918627 RepID=UPI003FA54759
MAKSAKRICRHSCAGSFYDQLSYASKVQLSWYEQKAVCILLSLLYLGIKNIKLGPTLPAFI